MNESCGSDEPRFLNSKPCRVKRFTADPGLRVMEIIESNRGVMDRFLTGWNPENGVTYVVTRSSPHFRPTDSSDSTRQFHMRPRRIVLSLECSLLNSVKGDFLPTQSHPEAWERFGLGQSNVSNYRFARCTSFTNAKASSTDPTRAPGTRPSSSQSRSSIRSSKCSAASSRFPAL